MMERKRQDDQTKLVESKDKTKLRLEANVFVLRSRTSNTKKDSETWVTIKKKQDEGTWKILKKPDAKMRQQSYPGIVQNYQYHITNKNYSLLGGPKNYYAPNAYSEKKESSTLKRCGKSCFMCARGMCCLF